MVAPVKGVRLPPECTTENTGHKETDQINNTLDSLDRSLVKISDSLKFRFKQLLQTQLRLLKYRSFDPETEELKYLLTRKSQAESTNKTNTEKVTSKHVPFIKKELFTFDRTKPSVYRHKDKDNYKAEAGADRPRAELQGKGDESVHSNIKKHVEMMAKINANRNAGSHDWTHAGNTEINEILKAQGLNNAVEKDSQSTGQTARDFSRQSDANSETTSCQLYEQADSDRIATRNNSALEKWTAQKNKLNQMKGIYLHEQTDISTHIGTSESTTIEKQSRLFSYQSQRSPKQYRNESSITEENTEGTDRKVPCRNKPAASAFAARNRMFSALKEIDHLRDFPVESVLENEDNDVDDPDEVDDVGDDGNFGNIICSGESDSQSNERKTHLYNFSTKATLGNEQLNNGINDIDSENLKGHESDSGDRTLGESQIQGVDNLKVGTKACNFDDRTTACNQSDSEVAMDMLCSDLEDRLSKRLASSISKAVAEAREEAVEKDADLDRMKATTQALCRVRSSLAEVEAMLQAGEGGHCYLQDAEEEIYKSIGDMLSVEECLHEPSLQSRVQHVIQRLEAVAWLSGSASYRSRVAEDLQPIVAQLRHLEDDLRQDKPRPPDHVTKGRLQLILFLVGLVLGLSIVIVSNQMPVTLVHVEPPNF